MNEQAIEITLRKKIQPHITSCSYVFAKQCPFKDNPTCKECEGKLDWILKCIKDAGYRIPAESEKELVEKVNNILFAYGERVLGAVPAIVTDKGREEYINQILALIKASHPAELKVLSDEEIDKIWGFKHDHSYRNISRRIAQAQVDSCNRQLKGEK